MLATRARAFLLLARSGPAARRFFASQPPTRTPRSPLPSTPSSKSAPAPAPAPASNNTLVQSQAVPGPISTQRAPPGPRKSRDGYSGGFYLALLGGLLLSAPVITYYYWEHRKVHMREKKEAILRDIHARVGAGAA